jgi:hypothetical protein
MQAAFVKEVERVGQDSVFWVRREASYALGALAKIVPVEIVVSSLVRFNFKLLNRKFTNSFHCTASTARGVMPRYGLACQTLCFIRSPCDLVKAFAGTEKDFGSKYVVATL